MSANPKVLAVQRFVDQQLANKISLPYADLLAVRDALKPYVEDMNDAGWYQDCEESHARLQAEWREINRQLERYRQAALQRWRASK